MSVLTKMAADKVKKIDDTIAHMVEFIATHRDEIAAAEEDLAVWRVERQELIDFLDKQGQPASQER